MTLRIVVGEPGEVAPDVATPEVVVPEPVAPHVVLPAVAVLEVAAPEVVHPEVTVPDASELSISGLQSDAPEVADGALLEARAAPAPALTVPLQPPAPEVPTLEVPTLEVPVVPEPVVEEPAIPPGLDEPAFAEPVPVSDTEAVRRDDLAVEAPPADEPVPSEELSTDEPARVEAPATAVPPLPRTEDLDAAPVDAERSPSLIGVVVLTAVLSAVITASLIAAFAWREPATTSAADTRRAQLVTEEDRRQLALEEERLANRAAAIVADDTRVSVSWDRLGLEARALAEEHQRSLDQADSLAGRLDILIERADALAGGATPLPESLRGESGRLASEARSYRTILGNVVAEIEAQQRVVLDHAHDAETRAHDRELLGLEVRVIHDLERLVDARRIVALLEGAGAKAHLFPTHLDDPSQHKGRLYYRGPDEERAARQIARLVETLELIDIEAVGRANPFLSLWVVGSPPVPVDTEEDPDLRDRFDP